MTDIRKVKGKPSDDIYPYTICLGSLISNRSKVCHLQRGASYCFPDAKPHSTEYCLTLRVTMQQRVKCGFATRSAKHDRMCSDMYGNACLCWNISKPSGDLNLHCLYNRS